MNLLSDNSYLSISSGDHFLDAAHDLIHLKEKEREEALRIRMEEERKREEQNSDQVDAARALCYSCKCNNSCSLKYKLTSPVCSRFENK